MSGSTGSMFRLAVCLGLILSLACLNTAQAADKIGEVGELQGEAHCLKSGDTEEKTINKGDPVELEAKISTKVDSKIWLKLDDESHNSLGEKSIVYINDFGSDGDSTYYHGHAEKGAVRYIKKLEVTDPPSSYVVTTPTALIVVEPTERAADFVVRAPNEFQTEVTVIWGKVTVKNILEEITKERTIRSCQRVYVDAGKKPSPKYWVSSETLRDMIELTTIPGTLPDDVPDCEPRERSCPCPWGMAMDIDGQCKPCAFYAGAMYDPDLCRCVCPCPPGFFPDSIDGECLPECPSDAPVAVPGIFPPDPDVLPHTGCPLCDCCPFGNFCTLSFPGDPTCPHFRCGDCGGPPGPGLPPFVVPPMPGDWYDCPKCCLCDTRFGGPGNPCGLNAAGFPSGALCGPGPRCISRNECIAQGGFFLRTEWRLPFGPCWVCRSDPPKYMVKAAAGPGGQCKECKKLTFKSGKPECVPIKDGTRCLHERKLRPM